MNKFLFFTLTLLIPLSLGAHSGNTDSYGCHTCRTNCPKYGLDYGEYHCHASKGLPQPIEPVRSIKSDTGNGVTVPAPEYKTYTPKPAEKVNVSVPAGTTNTSPKVNTSVPIPQTTYQEPAPTRTPSIEVSQPKKEKKNFLSRFFGWLF